MLATTCHNGTIVSSLEVPMTVPTRADAEAALAAARTAQTSLADRGHWLRTYLLVCAAGSVPLLLLVGLGGRVGESIGTTLWIVLCSALSWWGARQRVVLRSNKRRTVVAFGGWAVLYVAALLLGLRFFPGRPAFWVPAALVAAIPLVLVACWPTNQSSPDHVAATPAA